jgi:hypothetical protein
VTPGAEPGRAAQGPGRARRSRRPRRTARAAVPFARPAADPPEPPLYGAVFGGPRAEPGVPVESGADPGAVGEPHPERDPDGRAERDPAGGGGPRRGRRPLYRALLWAAALPLPLAGWFALDAHQDRGGGAGALDDACAGLLPVAETGDALGGGVLAEERRFRRDEGGPDDPGRALYLRCVVVRLAEGRGEHPARSAAVEVAVHGVPTPEADRVRRDGSLYGGADADRPVPLGHGWTGYFDGRSGRDASSARATAAVLLDCTGDGTGRPGADPAGGVAGGLRSDLLITVDGDMEGTAVDNPGDRVRLARIATGTARRAAERFGCPAPLGTPPLRVPLPVGEDEDVDPAETRGTCAGVPGFRGARMWESERGDTPREHCEVGDGERSGAYELDAYYGPYAEDMRRRMGADPRYDGAHTTGAVCPLDEEPALYTVRSRYGLRSSDGYQRRALTAFAARSAADRDCTVPGPPVPHRAGAE